MSNGNNNGTAIGGIGFCSVLFLLFLGLKLVNIINWSCIWVFALF